MKKSRFFLGASAFLLAISGALATKASLKNIKHIAGYTGAGGACHILGDLSYTTRQHNGSTVARTALGTRTLYTAIRIGAFTLCGGKVLYTNPQN